MIKKLSIATFSVFLFTGCVTSGLEYKQYGNGIPTTYLLPFATNIESVISSGYMVYTFINTDPSRAELASTLYASIGFMGTGTSTGVSYDDIGLWSYYPYRASWNRE